MDSLYELDGYCIATAPIGDKQVEVIVMERISDLHYRIIHSFLVPEGSNYVDLGRKWVNENNREQS